MGRLPKTFVLGISLSTLLLAWLISRTLAIPIPLIDLIVALILGSILLALSLLFSGIPRIQEGQRWSALYADDRVQMALTFLFGIVLLLVYWANQYGVLCNPLGCL